MNKYAVFSANDHHDYSIYVPLAARMWERIGFKSIILLTATHTDGKPNFRALDTILKHIPESATVCMIDAKGYSTATLAQVCRLVGYHIAPNPEDYVITSDADMIPLEKAFFDRDFRNSHLYGYDLTGRSQFPMCYAGMPRERWERLFGAVVPDVGSAAYGLMESYGHKSKSTDWHQYWDTDQHILTERVFSFGVENFEVIDRGMHSDQRSLNRIDRLKWEYVSGERYIDAHLPKWSRSDDSHAKVTDMLSVVAPDFDASWMGGYRSEFLECFNNG